MTKRQDFLIISFVNLLLFTFFQIGIKDPHYIFYGLLILLYFGYILFRFIKIYQYSIIVPKVVFIAQFILASHLLLIGFPNLEIGVRFLYLFVVSFAVYIMLLATNIFLVAEKRDERIPLMQPARMFIYLAILFSIFLWSNFLYKMPDFMFIPDKLGVIVQSISSIFIYFVILWFTKWFIVSERIGEITKKDITVLRHSLIFGVVVLSEFMILLLFVPYEAFAKSMVLMAIGYTVVNFSINYINHALSKKYYIESIFIILMVLLLTFLA